MTIQEHPSDVRSSLEEMGYSAADVDRAISAGHGSNISRAVEYLSENPTQTAPSPPEKNTVEYPHLASTQNATSAASSLAQPSYRGLNNARDSLDGIQIKRTSGTDAGPGQTTDNSHRNPDDELQRVLELSRQEQDDREMARALQLSKQDRDSKAQQGQDPDLMFAIQESLKDNQHNNTERAVSWQSHGFVTAKDRVRSSLDEPVGLKNIGNTCYLNSLLQVYFHLPDFRRAVMAFRPPEELLGGIDEDNKSLRDQSQLPQPTVEIPDDDIIENETPEERLERRLCASQPDQSFDLPADGDQLMNPADGASGTSGNHVEETQENSNVRNALRFVLELQKLFAAMALGNQNCVDPSGVVHSMRDAEGRPIVIGAQQDASEFNHLLLDIVERGLRSAANGTDSRQTDCTGNEMWSEMASASVKMDDSEDSENIVKDMFTARFRQEVRRTSCSNTGTEGASDTISGETNAIIVDATAKKYRDIHSGLEDYAVARIDDKASRSVDGHLAVADVKAGGGAKELSPGKDVREDDIRRLESTCRALKSVWFTRMPPFVVIYLQRVRYNRATKQAEKVHDKYDFSTQIAFDRYLLDNKEASARARSVVQRIRKERDSVQGLFDQYELFPGKGNASSTPEQDASMPPSGGQDPSPAGISQQVGTTMTSQPMDEIIDVDEPQESFSSAASRVQKRLEEALIPSTPHFSVEGIPEESLRTSIETLRAVLQQDQKRQHSLKRKLQSLHEEESNAYEGLDKLRYHLHAVLVHDGAPSSGHYWTFIRNWKASNDDTRWMKLSDSSVTYVSEEEMLAWSTGGKSKASAYCLIYGVESALQNSMVGEVSIAEESRKLLPASRLNEVELNRAEFERELGEQTMT